eukprot:1147155-Pelagomonas_calceolata.AAC.6
MSAVLGGTFAQQVICREGPYRSERDDEFLQISVDVRGKGSLEKSLESYVQVGLWALAPADQCGCARQGQPGKEPGNPVCTWVYVHACAGGVKAEKPLRFMCKWGGAHLRGGAHLFVLAVSIHELVQINMDVHGKGSLKKKELYVQAGCCAFIKIGDVHGRGSLGKSRTCKCVCVHACTCNCKGEGDTQKGQPVKKKGDARASALDLLRTAVPKLLFANACLYMHLFGPSWVRPREGGPDWGCGELMEGENAWLCEEVGQRMAATKRTCIKQLPHTLAIHLKRFEYDHINMQRKSRSVTYCMLMERLRREPPS